MALTASVKEELSRLDIKKSSVRKAEVSAMLRFAGGLHIISGRIVIEAEVDLASTARRLRAAIAEVYGHQSEIIVVSAGGLRRASRYVVRVVRDGGRKPAHRAAAAVQEAGLAGQRLAVAHYPHHVAAGASQSPGGHDDDLALVAVHFGDGGTEAAGSGGQVHFRLDHDPAGNDVQSACEPEHGRDFGLAD